MKLTPGINLTNILQAALTHADPKNADTLIDKFFALLGSENEKATRKHIDEIDPRSLSLSPETLVRSCQSRSEHLKVFHVSHGKSRGEKYLLKKQSKLKFSTKSKEKIYFFKRQQSLEL